MVTLYPNPGRVALLLCLLCLPLSAYPVDRYGEREVLARIVQELQHVDELLVEAAGRADPDARIHFQYGPARRDLMTIRQGVETHLLTPDDQPRTFKPLSGDYRR